MDEPLEINGHNYKVGTLDAFKQFHVARRVMPILAQIGINAAKLQDMGKLSKSEQGFDAILGPVSDVVAKMPEEDVNYILHSCLAVCKREQPDGRWAPVFVRGQLMFEDLGMQGMLRLTITTIRENLGSFFPGMSGEPD